VSNSYRFRLTALLLPIHRPKLKIAVRTVSWSGKVVYASPGLKVLADYSALLYSVVVYSLFFANTVLLPRIEVNNTTDKQTDKSMIVT